MNAFVTVISVMIVAISQVQSETRSNPAEPREVVAFFMGKSVAKYGEHDHIKRRIGQAPQAYVPIFKDMLVLPTDPANLMEGEGLEQRNRVVLVFLHRLLEELGQEHADPLLLDFFQNAKRLWIVADRQLSEAVKQQEKAGGFKAAPAEVNNRVRDSDRITREIAGLMGFAISSAERLGSPVFVDPILEMMERGPDWRRYHFGYLLPFRAQRPDIQPRIDKILADPKNAHMKWHYDKAVEVYRKGLVQVQPSPQSESPAETITQAPAQPPDR
jgi:hypothetical protein